MTANDRKPKGYIGRNHLTVGSDILAILKVASLPESLLGAELAGKLKDVRADEWYPINLLLEPLEILGQQLGERGLAAIGIKLFQLSHEANVKRDIHTVSELLYGFDAIYHSANRGEGIGGWTVQSFKLGLALLEKTTPHHCKMEEGIMRQALITIGVAATVSQTQCFRQGADSCIFKIESTTSPERWGKGR